MYWAKQRGIAKSLNPFDAFIYQDRQHVEDILSEAHYLRR